MAIRSTRSSRRIEGLTTRNDNIVATTPPVNKPGHDSNLRPRANTGQKKRSIHTADLDEGPYDKKRPRFAIEINSKPIIPPNTRPLVVRPHAPTAATTAVPKNPDPQHDSKKPEQPPRQQTNHRQKVTNGIKHELDKLQPSDADTKDEKRKLRSQEGARFKSELSAYFPEYDEIIGNEPKEDHFLNIDTPIIITDSAKPAGPKTEEPASPKRKRRPSNTEYPVKVFPDSLFDDIYDAQRVDFSFLDSHYKVGKQLKDPLPDEYFETVHRRPERQERAIRNSDRGRAQHEKDQVIRLLEGLQGHDWLKLMGVSGVTESKKKEYEPARDHFIKGCEVILEKFRLWKEEERRRKQEKEQAQAEAKAEQEAEEEADEEEAQAEDEDEDEGDLSDGDPPDYSDVDASAARQLHEEAIARSSSVPPAKRPRKRLKSEEHQETPRETEREFISFFPKPYLREAALGKHRRSGRSVAAWGHPIPEISQKDFDLPQEYRDDETLKANARRKRRIKRRSDG
ncbi:something about silencing, SAS, complex subunit 4-domain-containing protein [Xylogone sp. PMI_703]|nr:something about silencing, SAS, complex subunit 4-domain-containing protein [Xylogone sp. PMI_703]